MHQIGWIKWFDEEKGYGCIGWKDHNDIRDIRVSRDQVQTGLKNLKEEVFVSFDVSPTPGRQSALKVRLLREESCVETLVSALCHGDPFFQVGFERVRQLQPRKPKHGKKIARGLEQCIDSVNLVRFGGLVNAIRSLPNAILKESTELRQRLPLVEHLAFCRDHLQAITSEGLCSEILNRARNTPSSDLEFWSTLPLAYYEHASDIRAKVPLSRRIPFLVSRIRKAEGVDQVVADKKELLESLSSCEELGIWRQIDTDWRFSTEFWKITPRSIRLDAVRSSILTAELIDRCPAIVEFVSSELSTLSKDSLQTWERLTPVLKERQDFQHWREIESLLALIDGCLSDYGYEQRTSWDGNREYANIDDVDRRLAQEWIPRDSSNQDFHMARMLSARCAEKVALRFYESLGHRVVDVSRTQLKDGIDDWRDFDLLVDGSKTVDVKNARPPLNRRDRYTEHTVRRFKETRSGNVAIAGVLSPYVGLERLQNARNDCNLAHVVFLGETDRTTITKLEQRFSGVGNVVIKSEVFNVIPPWAFEYPAELYDSRNTIRRKLQQLGFSGTASLSELKGLGCNPLPAFLLAGIALPPSWVKDLSGWESAFYRMLLPQEDNTVNMPVLFLTLLTHFLKMASQLPEAQGYEPALYRSFFYAPGDSQYKRPCGIYDPLDSNRSQLA